MIKAKPLQTRWNLTKGVIYEFKKLEEGYTTTNDKGTSEYFYKDYFKEFFEVIEDDNNEISSIKNNKQTYRGQSKVETKNKEWILEDDKLNKKLESGANDGSANAFYQIPDWVKDCDLLAEYLELDHYEANILKTLWINKGKRHDGTNKNRELNKRLHYAQKSIEKNNRLEK